MRNIVLMIILLGCQETTIAADPAVAACHDSARSTCTAIGYPGNQVCLLTLSQGCSEQDAAAAHAFCTAARGLQSNDSCELVWR